MRRHRSIHEVDISNLEAALRAEEPGGQAYETPREEIARLRKMELEPQHYHVDISKEVRGSGMGRGGDWPGVDMRGMWGGRDVKWEMWLVTLGSPQLSTPDKVLIPERYIDLEPVAPLSPEELKEKQKKVERIKTLIAKSR